VKNISTNQSEGCSRVYAARPEMQQPEQLSDGERTCFKLEEQAVDLGRDGIQTWQ
jgi:hypothetical protein